MSVKPWKTLKSRLVYQNPWTSVREDIAEMPDGNITIYGVVEAGECVGILPFLDDERVVLVRQYRYVFGESHRWEMPTGGVKEGETLLDAAHRELREEKLAMMRKTFNISTRIFPVNPSCRKLPIFTLAAA